MNGHLLRRFDGRRKIIFSEKKSVKRSDRQGEADRPPSTEKKEITMRIITTLALSCLSILLLAQCSSNARMTNKEVLEYKTSPIAKIEIGKGELIEELRTLDANFQEIVVGNGIYLHLMPEADYVQVKAQANILSLVETKVQNGKLNVRLTGSLKTKEGIHLYMGLQGASKLTIKEGARLDMDGSIKTEKLELSILSGSYGKIQVENEYLNAKVMSGSVLIVEGETKQADIFVNSGSVFSGKQYEVGIADVEINDASVGELMATESIAMKAEGAAILQYSGQAEITREEHDNSSIISRKHF